jgi:very-short-patch-repair endonuclease
MLKYDARLKPHARRLRSEMTEGERRLWARLRGKQLMNVQFYRQKPLGGYIVDFYAPRARLVLEVDGSRHWREDQIEHDACRDQWLDSQGGDDSSFHQLGSPDRVGCGDFCDIRRVYGASGRKSPQPPFAKGGLQVDFRNGFRYLKATNNDRSKQRAER